MTDYAESDYVYDDMLDQHPSHSQQVDQFGNEFKYGAYQAMLLGHKPGGFQLDDAGIFQRQSFGKLFSGKKWFESNWLFGLFSTAKSNQFTIWFLSIMNQIHFQKSNNVE